MNWMTMSDILEAYPALYNRKIMKVDVQGGTLDCWIYLMSDFREELLEEEYIEEYSSKTVPWSTEYLNHKDGDYLFKLLRKNKT